MIKLYILLLNLSLALFFTTNLVANTLPDLGSPDLVKYDAQTEIKLGKAFLTALHKHHPVISDLEILNYVRNIGHKISSKTGNKRHFKFYVIDNSGINAFAGPNGIIGIHTGLIMAAKTEDELAAVIAHEIAHVTQNHLSRRFNYQQNLSASNIASIIAAILIGSQDPNAGMAVFMGGASINIQQQLRNSRIHEYEADYFGIKYLADAGYNPFAMADFFGRLSKSGQFYEFKLPEILRTHPVTDSRLAKADDRARLLPPFKVKNNNSLSLSLIKKRIHAISQTTKKDPFVSSSNSNKHTICYENNLNKLLNKPKPESNFNPSCLKTAITKHPKERLFKIINAQVIGINDPKKAHEQFNYLREIFPRDSSIPFRQAKMWQKHQQTDKAIKILASASYFYRYRLYKLLAELHATQNELDYSYYYVALANFHIGNVKFAKHLLEKSKKLALNNNSNLLREIEHLSTNLSQDIEIKEKTIK